MKTRGLVRSLLTLAVFVTVVAVVAGCGGSGSSDSSDGSETSAGSESSGSSEANGSTETAGSESGEGSESESAFPNAVKRNAEFEQRPTSIGITTPVGKPIPQGKRISFIQCGVPACAVEGELLKEATDALGWKMKSINAGGTPEEIKAAYEQAIREKPDAVLGSGFPKSLYAPELAELKKMNIPVVQSFVGDETGDGLTGVIGGPAENKIQGEQVALYILAHSEDESITVGSVTANGFETVVNTSNAIEETVTKECPGCSVKTLEAPVSSIGADLPTRVASFLSSNPEIEWTYVGYNDMVVGLPTALKGAGLEDAKLATVQPNPAVATYLEKGENLQAIAGPTPAETFWREIDLLARSFTGQPYKEDLDDSTLPYWTLTQENLPSSTEEFPAVVDYQEQFKELWGVE